MEAMIVRCKALTPAADGFELRSGSPVVNPMLFHEKLMQDIEDGPGGPRALIGALEKDVEEYLKVRS